MNKIAELIVFVILSNAYSYGQNAISRKELETLPYVPEFPSKNYPITRDTLNKFPDEIKIEGTLEDCSTTVSCGPTVSCGTLKVRLQKKNKAYGKRYNYVYVAVPCLVHINDTLWSKMDWTLRKIKTNDNSPFLNPMFNYIDSHGLPFYEMKTD